MNVLKTQYLRGKALTAVAQVIAPISEGINGGCNLYIGTATTGSKIKVKNISGDEVEFNNLIQGTILPFPTTEIVSLTGVSTIIALW